MTISCNLKDVKNVYNVNPFLLLVTVTLFLLSHSIRDLPKFVCFTNTSLKSTTLLPLVEICNNNTIWMMKYK
jgi:hypothetical protein